MAFPEEPLGARIELCSGGVWEDISGDVRLRDPVTIGRGRADEGTRTDPASCKLLLSSPNGRYSPRNPLSPHFGRIGRNTPIRVSVRGAPARMELDGSPTGYASTPGGTLGTPLGFDARCEVATVCLGQSTQNRILMGRWAEGDTSWTLRLNLTTLLLNCSDTGTGGQWFISRTLPALPHHAAFRAKVVVDEAAGVSTAALYWARSLDGPWMMLGSQIVRPAATPIFAGTAPLTVGGYYASASPRLPFTGYAYRAELRDAAGSVIASPDFTQLTPGTVAFTDSSGLEWTLHGSARITDLHRRFEGEVSEWPPSWDPGEHDVTTSVEASGILRRLGQGAKPLESTLRRRIPSFGPTGYWPLEDGSDASQAYSPIPGVPPMITSGLDYGSSDGPAGSSPLPSFTETATYSATVPTSASTGAWMVAAVLYVEAPPEPEESAGGGPAVVKPQRVLEFRTTGTISRVIVDVLDYGLRALYYSGNTLVWTAFLNQALFFGRWNRIEFTAQEQPGGGLRLHAGFIDVEAGGYFTATTVTGTSGIVPQVWASVGAKLAGARIGHIGIFPASDTSVYQVADNGFRGERMLSRLRRLVGEESLPMTVTGGDGMLTAQMGPQRPETILDLLGSMADVDGGVLGEELEALALHYRCRESLYTQTPALELDYAARGEVAPPLEPTDDDQGLRNDITLSRTDGSSARAVLNSGPMSVLPPPDGVGVYDASETVNVAFDTQLPERAAWLLHLGTWDETRYPKVTVRLHKAPHLIPSVLALREGDRLTIANPPPHLPPQLIDLIVRGWTETIGIRTWEITFTCTPAGPWNVATVEHPTFGIADTDGTELAADIDETTTAVPITVTAGPAWTAAAEDLPYDVAVGGEVMTVVAVSGAGPAQTFTVTRSVNGIVKAHAAGAAVALPYPAYVAL